MSEELHPFIEKLEKGGKSPFSVFKVSGIEMINTKNTKFELVYINSIYPTDNYDEVIYKTSSDFYLLFKSTPTQGQFDLSCYFPTEKLNQVQVFLNSILKKNDTTNIKRS